MIKNEILNEAKMQICIWATVFNEHKRWIPIIEAMHPSLVVNIYSTRVAILLYFSHAVFLSLHETDLCRSAWQAIVMRAWTLTIAGATHGMLLLIVLNLLWASRFGRSHTSARRFNSLAVNVKKPLLLKFTMRMINFSF